MSNRRNIQFTYNPHNKATILDCSFTVNHTDSAGLGVTNLNASGRIANVFMNTNQTPGKGVGGITNPNPQAGIIIVQMSDNYNKFLNVMHTLRNPLSGSGISSGLSVGNVYVITVLGTTTLAQWQAAGVPTYITPAVGVAFVAAATSFTGTGRVQAPATAGTGIQSIEKLGSASVMNSTGANIVGAGVGMSLFLGCYNSVGSLPVTSGTAGNAVTLNGGNTLEATGGGAVAVTDSKVLAAPADSSIIHLFIYLNDSAQGV